jgi:hypothetical protein
VCFECHAEIHSYNDKHPRGRKFQPQELRLHKDQWLKICSERRELLIAPTRHADVGPLQALIDELDFNGTLARKSSGMLRAVDFTSSSSCARFTRDQSRSFGITSESCSSTPTAQWVLPKAMLDVRNSQAFESENWMRATYEA